MLGNVAVVGNSDWRSPDRNKINVIEKAVGAGDRLNKLLTALQKYSIFSSPKMEIQNDLCLRNVIQTCLDFRQPQVMAKWANYFLDKVVFK